MSRSMQLLDPEIEGLLEELSRESGSTLFRVARPKELKGLAPAQEEPLAAGSRRAPAEAKLLDCYREEVAYLLRCRYYESYLAQDHLTAIRPFLAPREGGAAGAAGSESSAVQLHREVAGVSANFEGSTAADLVVQAAMVAVSSPEDRLAIAAAALRLVPSDTARMYLGYEYLAQGWIGAALDCFTRVSEGALDARLAASSRVAAGVAEMARGDFRAALEQFGLAASAECGPASAELNGLAAALQLGDEGSARALVQQLDAGGASRAALVEAWSQSLKVSRAAGRWSPTAGAKRVLQGLHLSPSSQAGVIFDAFSE